MCFIRSRQNYLSRYHASISYFSRLTSRKIQDIPATLGVYNLISRNFKTQFHDIPSQKVANLASRKRPDGQVCNGEVGKKAVVKQIRVPIQKPVLLLPLEEHCLQ